jgi:hypothetical protein
MWWCFLLVASSFYACGDEAPKAELFNASDRYNKSIQVEVRHLYDLSSLSDSLLANATVLLYMDKDQFLYDGYPDAYRITDSTGIAFFEFLPENYYYMRILHEDLGEKRDSVSTPDNTLSFVYITYF